MSTRDSGLTDYMDQGHEPLVVGCPKCRRVCWAPGPCPSCRGENPPHEPAAKDRERKKERKS